jgi:hydroxyacylglutathione hydrolase
MGIATGDFVFVGDLGRPDLLEQAAGMHGVQEPSARTLYNSLPRFTSMEDYVQVWPAHGAGSTCGKALGAVPTTTVGYERLYNASLDVASRGEDAFVQAILAGQPEPQTYFARMKRDNKLGAPVLGNLPNPRRLTAFELGHIVKESKQLIVDTRLDRSGFMAHHIPGSIYAPMNKSFNTVVGSLVEDETTPIVLIIEEEHVEEAVRDLIRIGYDNVVAYADTNTLDRYFDEGGESATIKEIMFDELDAYKAEHGGIVLDVRFSNEFDVLGVPGAFNASYTRMPDYVKNRVPKGDTLYVHCGTGARAAAASSFLANNGFDVVYVNGSFEEYAADHDLVAAEPALV